MRPLHLTTGGGGHGDHILEIACSESIPNVEFGKVVEVELRGEVLSKPAALFH
jgi:hypothetical protein